MTAQAEGGAHTPRPDGGQAREQLLSVIPLTERRRELAGVSTAVLEGGDGPPIVFLQGEFAAVWMRVIPDLVATRRVVVPDLPGLGASTVPDGPPDVDRALAWLGELVEATCPTPPVLVGKGPAGALAARFAAGHRDRLDALVLVDSYGLAPFRPPLRMALTFMGTVLHPSERSLERSFRHYCFTDLDAFRDDMGQHYEWLTAYAVDRFGTSSVRAAMRRLMRGLGAAIPAEDLAGIAAPTTLVWGREDVGVPLAVAEGASAAYGWPLYVIDGARDDPALEQPTAFLEALHAAIAPGQRAFPMDRSRPRQGDPG